MDTRQRRIICYASSVFISFDFIKGFLWPTASPIQFWLIDVSTFVLLPAFLTWFCFVHLKLPFRELFLVHGGRGIRAKHGYGLTISEFFAATAIVYLVTYCIFEIALCCGSILASRFPTALAHQYAYSERNTEGYGHSLVLIYFAVTAGVVEVSSSKRQKPQPFLEGAFEIKA